ncbi:cation transporter [Vibrio sp. F74]|uniref:cation transporter n=1 Tax=Vibrio sp. F74 TaxID=700020 RepID=UPI0035F5C5CA
MNNQKHRVSVNEINLVVRNLRLSQVNAETRRVMLDEIDHLFGLDEVSYNDHEEKICLAYDASRLCLDGIEDIIRKYGAEIHDDWWTHTKESYYKFADQNVKENAKHTPWSCHQSLNNATKRRRNK